MIELTKIKNKAYRKFLDTGEIDTISNSEIRKALYNIKGKNQDEGRALLLTLYYTGARPNEVLRLRSKDVYRKDAYVAISMPGSKGGLSRIIYLQYAQPLVREIYHYAKSLFADMYMFHSFRNIYVRKVRKKNGEIVERKEISGKLNYFIKKCFQGVIEGSIPPYFLRHNRFSKLAMNDASDREIQLLKGCRGSGSIGYYTHLSSKSAKKVARKIN